MEILRRDPKKTQFLVIAEAYKLCFYDLVSRFLWYDHLVTNYKPALSVSPCFQVVLNVLYFPKKPKVIFGLPPWCPCVCLVWFNARSIARFSVCPWDS